MANALGRLAEAYTCTGTCTSKITDEGFSYSVRGELADIYESTPNSGGYYHVNGTYWASGLLDTLNAYSSNSNSLIPTITYVPDGEGRVDGVTASTGQIPVPTSYGGVSYNVASQPTWVNFGSNDEDSYQYDTTTGRMIQFALTVNGKSVTGMLGWNANGTLDTLGINDQINPANNQTCTYSHDDLGRLSGVSCPSVWTQTFGFDPFGNITKTGTVSFQALYNAANQISSLPGATISYDADGNLTSDGAHTYAWDADGNSTTVDSTTITYDALDRAVEQTTGTSHTQVVYGLDGGKFALMSGTTLSKAFVALPAGAEAVYNSSGLDYYRHADWLGSSRLASTTSQTVYSDVSYAPYGEPYNQYGTADPSFTGQNQDTASGLYDFLYREQSSVQGRWISPDPAGMGAVDPTNPQTWNRYAYVLNGPMSNIDPQGLDCWVVPDGRGGSMLMYSGTGSGCSTSITVTASPLPPGAYGGATGGGIGFPSGPTGLLGGVGGRGGSRGVGAKTPNNKQTKQQCVQAVLSKTFGSFTAKYIIPEFSLLSLTDGIQQLWNGGGAGGLGEYAKGTGVSVGAKVGILAGVGGYGKILTISGRNMAASSPALTSTATDLLESGAFWTTTASTAAELAGGAGLAVTAFATGADAWARQQCKNVP